MDATHVGQLPDIEVASSIDPETRDRVFKVRGACKLCGRVWGGDVHITRKVVFEDGPDVVDSIVMKNATDIQEHVNNCNHFVQSPPSRQEVTV